MLERPLYLIFVMGLLLSDRPISTLLTIDARLELSALSKVIIQDTELLKYERIEHMTKGLDR